MKTVTKLTSLLAAALLLTGCGQSIPEAPESEAPAPVQETQAEAPAQETEAPPVEEDPLPEIGGGINPLTGEAGYNEAAEGKRPVAVMVNNLSLSYPQYGVSQADIIYEIPVEGGITRFMAIYADYTNVPDVCSVRSCRYYFPVVAMGMDAIYCHWGAEQNHAVAKLNSLGIDHLDGSAMERSLLFYRDPDRVGKYASEHTGYLKGEELPKAIEQYGFRTDAYTNSGAFSFSDGSYVPAENTAKRVNVNFSESRESHFTYDEGTQTYLLYYYDNPQIDGKTEQQLAFTNVFVLQTEIGFLDEGNYLRSVALDGGSGYYVSKGGVETITWSKNGEAAPIRVFHADGSELSVNPGKSYIGIISGSRPVTFSAE
ncbi:MAG: DUF3048 domain-containing protein [Oscillospiraceae bacterium]|nr:DUF3048 domain-containing protein [Oscillospiraceae bacterium]